MSGTGHYAGTTEPGPGYLQRIEIDAEGHAQVSKFWTRTAGWLGKNEKNAKTILFWLPEQGRAEGFSEVTHQDRINALLKDPDVGEHASLVFYRGSWQADQGIIVPEPVVAHILSGAVVGQMWAWATPGKIELWDEPTRQKRTAGAIAAVNNALPDEGLR